MSGAVAAAAVARPGETWSGPSIPAWRWPGIDAEIDEFARPVGEEGQRACSRPCRPPVRARGVLVDHDIVLGAFAVDQVDLHSLALMHLERGIDLKMVGACMSPRRVPEPVGRGKGGTGTGTGACAISGGASAAGGVACRCCWAEAGAKQEMNNVVIASASFF